MKVKGFRRIATADTIPHGQGMLVPRSGTGGGGEYGADITDSLRTFAITREPVAHRVVFTVAHDIFDNWFELQLEGDEESEKSQTFDKSVQQKLSELNAKQELARMAVFERAYGWAIIVLGYKDSGESLADEAGNIQDLQEIKAYGPTQVTVSEGDLDKDRNSPRFGLPVIYHVRRADKMQGDMKVHYSRVIHFATRLINHDWQGQSVLDPIWDDLNVLRNIRWGMGQTMYRYGSGFPDITFTGAELDDINTWIDSGAFENLNARTYFAHSEDQLLEFKGLQGRALDPMNYYLPPMEHISAGTGIPLAMLRGAQAGALTGSEVNQMEYYGLVSDEQSAYEKGIREIIDVILGLNPDKRRVNPVKYKFNWLGGFELDQEKQANIKLIRAQELQILGQFFTRNEIRKMIDPDASNLPEKQGGNEILGRMNFGDQQKEDEENKFSSPLEQLKQGASYLVTEMRQNHEHANSHKNSSNSRKEAH